MKHFVLFRGRPGVSAVRRCSILLFLFLFLLSPYLDVGGGMLNAGVVTSLIFFLFFWPLLIRVVVRPSFLFLAVPLAAFVLYNSMVSLAGYQGPVTMFTQLAIKMMFYVAVGFVLAMYLGEFQLSEEQVTELLLRLVLYVVIINSALALVFFLNQELRTLAESFLYSDESMNINYELNTRRMRGLASSGGAALSVFHALGIILSAWLYLSGRIGILLFAFSSVLIACSMLVIGRSGIVLLVVSFPLLVVLGYVNSTSPNRLKTVALVLLILMAILSLPLLAWMILPRSMFEYAIGFLYGGIEGVKEEGTLAIIASFYQFPQNISELLMGVGNYSGAFAADTSADPGYMKTITALGIPLAVVFYMLAAIFSVVLVFARDCSYFIRGIMILMVFAVLVVELKEPFLLQNYTGRLFWLLFGCAAFYWRPRRVDILQPH